MTTFAEIRAELAKRKPEELPVVLEAEDGDKRIVIGFNFNFQELVLFNNMTAEYTGWSEQEIQCMKVASTPKRKKVLYQAVFGIVERIEVSQFLFATEHEAKLFYKECFISLLTDRPIEIEVDE